VTALDFAISAILSLATAANLVLLFAVIRRLRMLEAGGPATSGLPSAGTRIAGFRATDSDGRRTDVGDFTGGPHLVAFVMTNCNPCHAMLSALRTDTRFDPARTFIFIAGQPGHPATQEVLDLARGLGRTTIVDHDGPVAAAFGGVDAFPTLVSVLDGRVVSSGRSLDDVTPASLLSPVG
jgi:hypothetical protein